jgi:hypothetical protein
MPDFSPYITAAGAVGAAWLVDHWDELKPSSPGPPRTAAMDSALERFVTIELPCNAPRLASVASVTGAPIRQLPSGAGQDFVREFLIQRGSLVDAFGSFVPGLEWPRMPAHCAQQWIERWLDAWQAANTSNPRAFRVEQKVTSAPDTSSVPRFLWSSVKDVLGIGDDTHAPLPGHDSYERVGSWRTAATPARLSALGRAWSHLRQLHSEASAAAGLGAVADVFGGLFGSGVSEAGQQVWVGARRVTQALYEFAGQMDVVGFHHPDARSEAVAQLKKDLHPVRFVEKAVDVAVAPVELAAQHVVGPVLSATLGALASSLLPWLAVGGAVYLLVKRVAP